MKNPFKKDTPKDPPRSNNDKKKDTYIHQGLTPARRKDDGERRYREMQERTHAAHAREARERDERERRDRKGR